MRAVSASFHDPLSRQSHCRLSKGGFALVLALGLMAFIVLLLMSLSAFLRVEQVLAADTLTREQARQSALLGVQIALGQLQAELGPDQRVSARSDIVQDEAAAVDTLVHTHWTGVWESQGELRTWLVSGNQLGQLEYEPESVLGAEAVRLFPANASGEGEVAVPAVVVHRGDDVVGRYAYWVGDEGIKAKLGIESNALPVVDDARVPPEYFGIHAVDGLSWYPHANQALERRLLDWGTLQSYAQLAGDGQALSLDRFHDLTFHGHGVIANSRSGGLRKDLTAGLEASAVLPEGSMFGPAGGGSPSAADPGGPLWSQLRSWTNAQSSGGTLSVRPSTDEQTGVFPVLTHFQLAIIPAYDPNDNNRVYMQMLPAVVLWNPYDVPLAQSDYTIRAGRTLFAPSEYVQVMRALFHQWRIQTQNNSGDWVNATLQQLDGPPLVFHLENVSLDPGEAKVFTIDGNSPYFFEDNPTPGMNLLREGFRPFQKFYFPLGNRTLTQDANGELRDSYRYSIPATRVHSVRLARGRGTNETPLTEALFLNPTTSTNPPEAIMEPFDSMEEIDTSLAVGVRHIFNYVNNATIGSPLKNKWLASHNPRASVVGPYPTFFAMPKSIYDKHPANNPSYISRMEADGSSLNIATVGFGSRAYTGFSESSDGSNRTILFEASPGRGRLHSIGQLMQAPLYRRAAANYSNHNSRVLGSAEFSRFDNLLPAYAVGSSLADPFIPLESTHVDWGAFPKVEQFFTFGGFHYDYAYLLNEALWDGYFFSSRLSADDPPEDIYNPRMQVWRGWANAVGYAESAASLWIDGAFNVNSTSVEAWSALLASFYQETEPESAAYPFRRLAGAPGGVFSGNAENSAAYDGFRALSLSQIRALAEAIVDQVRERGPFVGLSAFVNRSLDSASPTEHKIEGALSAALSAAGINAELEAYAVTPFELSGQRVPGSQAAVEQGYRTADLPGWLSQADLLSRIGSVLSARSDVFRIRAYGEVPDHSGTGAAPAVVCEMIVQRLPEYVDSSQSPETEFEALNAVNRDFGRRFAVISFRWLEGIEE
jgi:hypothetical protein